MRIGYLVNQYPAPSHTFIRREIQALECLDIEVVRFSVRDSQAALIDPVDVSEKKITQGILSRGRARLMGTALRTAFLHPLRMLTSLRLCRELGRNSSRGLTIQLIYLVEACTLLSLLRKQKVAHVHAHFGTNSTTVAMLCESLGGPTFSFTAHGPDEFDAPMDMSLGLKTERASFVAAISDYARSQVYRWCPWDDWSKVHIVPCGIDARFVDAEPPAVVQSKRFFWAGRISEEKGLPILLEACQRLDDQGIEFEVQMAGAGHLRESFEKEISAKGLEDRMTFAGWLDDSGIRTALEESICLIIPSFSEGLPVILMEAMARARPAIATRIAAIPELLIHGQQGWVVAPGNAEELADAMREALGMSAEELTGMGAAGRKRVLARHDIRGSARILADLFRA